MQNENIIRRVGPDKVATGRLLIMTLNGATLSPDEKKADKNHRNIWCACEHLCVNQMK